MTSNTIKKIHQWFFVECQSIDWIGKHTGYTQEEAEDVIRICLYMHPRFFRRAK